MNVRNVDTDAEMPISRFPNGRKQAPRLSFTEEINKKLSTRKS